MTQLGDGMVTYLARKRRGKVEVHIIPDENLERVICAHEALTACGIVDTACRAPGRTPYRSEVCPACLTWLEGEFPAYAAAVASATTVPV